MAGPRRPHSTSLLSIRLCRRYLRHSQCSGKSVALPLFIVVLGAAWLVDNLQIVPAVNWVWTVSLGAPGILVLLFARWNSVNFIIGAFMTVASLFSLLRQTQVIGEQVMVPCLTIVFGAVLLFIRLVHIPLPRWMRDAE